MSRGVRLRRPRLADPAVEPGDFTRVAAAAELFERLVPRGAKYGVHLGGHGVGARGHQPAQSHLADHDVTVGTHHTVPQPELRGVTPAVAVDALAGVFGDFEAKYRPRPQRVGQGSSRTNGTY